MESDFIIYFLVFCVASLANPTFFRIPLEIVLDISILILKESLASSTFEIALLTFYKRFFLDHISIKIAIEYYLDGFQWHWKFDSPLLGLKFVELMLTLSLSPSVEKKIQPEPMTSFDSLLANAFHEITIVEKNTQIIIIQHEHRAWTYWCLLAFQTKLINSNWTLSFAISVASYKWFCWQSNPKTAFVIPTWTRFLVVPSECKIIVKYEKDQKCKKKGSRQMENLNDHHWQEKKKVQRLN